MAAKTHRTALVLIPPEELWGPIQAIRRVQDSKYRRWMPHLTILHPFRPASEFEALLGPLAKACRVVPPFPVELASFHHFRHGPQSFTLWLAPRPVEPLLDLQARLEAVVPDCGDVRRPPGGFTPHLSLGQVRGDLTSLLDLQRSLEGSWKPLSFVAGEVCLIARGEPPDDVFRVSARIDLGERAEHREGAAAR